MCEKQTKTCPGKEKCNTDYNINYLIIIVLYILLIIILGSCLF